MDVGEGGVVFGDDNLFLVVFIFSFSVEDFGKIQLVRFGQRERMEGWNGVGKVFCLVSGWFWFKEVVEIRFVLQLRLYLVGFILYILLGFLDVFQIGFRFGEEIVIEQMVLVKVFEVGYIGN